MPRRAGSLLLVALALLPAPTLAQQPGVEVPAREALAGGPYAPATAAGPLTLADSVRIALRHSPNLAVQAQAVERARGRARAALGAFDASWRLASGVLLEQSPIRPAFRASELNNRLLLSVTADVFRDLNRSFRDILEGTATTPPPCPPGFTDIGPVNIGLLVDGRDPKELELLGIDRDVFFRVGGDLLFLQRQANLANLCATDVGTRVEDILLAQYLAPIDFAGSQGLQGILTSVTQIRRESIGLLTEVTEAIAARARLGLERLGPVPDDQLRRSFLLEAGYAKPLRSGPRLSFDLRLQTDEQAYRDKPLDPGFGGLAIPNLFPSQASATLVLPLARGRGREANTATLRAAELALAAEQDRLRHVASEEAYRAVLAHLAVLSAQATQALLEESAARQARLVELTRAQFEAGDLARIDVERVEARAAAVASAASRARQDVVEARLSLAETIGLDVPPGGEAPAVTDRLADGPVEAPLAAWVANALARRRDLRAAERQVTAASTLTAGAAANLRRRFDLSITGGLSNRYESPFFRFLEDERFPIISDFQPRPVVDSPVRWYSPRGVWRSVTGRWEPFVQARFTIDFPLGNHEARGRLLQAQASERDSRVVATELDRAIRASLVAVAEAVERAARAVERQRDAAERSAQALEGTLERLRAGEVTVIDTLTSEEALTRDRLELARQRFAYLGALARLAFEAGELVRFEDEGRPTETMRVPAVGWLTR